MENHAAVVGTTNEVTLRSLSLLALAHKGRPFLVTHNGRRQGHANKVDFPQRVDVQRLATRKLVRGALRIAAGGGPTRLGPLFAYLATRPRAPG